MTSTYTCKGQSENCGGDTLTERSVTHLQILLSLFQTKTSLKESLASFFILFFFLFEVLKMPFIVGKLRKDASVGSDQGAELDGLGALV